MITWPSFLLGIFIGIFITSLVATVIQQTIKPRKKQQIIVVGQHWLIGGVVFQIRSRRTEGRYGTPTNYWTLCSINLDHYVNSFLMHTNEVREGILIPDIEEYKLEQKAIQEVTQEARLSLVKRKA